MLSKQNRFHGLGSLNHVYKRGRIVRSPYCAMKYLVNKNADTFKVSVVVSKKIAKSAPVRNRIRRRLYEAIRSNAKLLTNQEIVVTVFDDRFLNMPYKELEASVKRQLKDIERACLNTYKS
ncbi:MAG TPA: ribonuclease P protein component [Candidatus Saccharibacteria bacterium]|nr:ribonuclease P protein component [Candidatus Saccharibacteria bacterium]